MPYNALLLSSREKKTKTKKEKKQNITKVHHSSRAYTCTYKISSIFFARRGRHHVCDDEYVECSGGVGAAKRVQQFHFVLFIVVEKRRSHSKKQSKKQKTKRGVLFVFIFSLWTDDEF